MLRSYSPPDSSSLLLSLFPCLLSPSRLPSVPPFLSPSLFHSLPLFLPPSLPPSHPSSYLPTFPPPFPSSLLSCLRPLAPPLQPHTLNTSSFFYGRTPSLCSPTSLLLYASFFRSCHLLSVVLCLCSMVRCQLLGPPLLVLKSLLSMMMIIDHVYSILIH